jgi:hypothetical protein
MDLRDLITLAGIVNPEVLNRIQPSAPAADCGCGVEEEAPAAGFDRATTEPSEETFDDPMTSAGSTVDLSLRRYLKAKGDHVTVDENVYPDYTVEDVNKAYSSFKESKERPYVAVHAKKGKTEVTGSSSYDAAKKAAEKWKLKSTAGIDVKLADVTHVATESVNEADDDDDRDELTKKLFPKRSRDDMEKSDRERNRAMNAKRFMKSGKPSRSREWGAYESVSEEEAGTYMKQWYNYSEDFAMLELYVDGKLVDEWSDYFGANETGNPLQAKFISMAKENGIDPVGLKVIDGEDGDEGVFTTNGIKWNSNEATESLRDIKKLAGIAEADIDTDVATASFNPEDDDADPFKQDYGMFTKQGNGEVAMYVQDAAQLLIDGDYSSREEALRILLSQLKRLAKNPEFEEASSTDVRERAIAAFDKMLEMTESLNDIKQLAGIAEADIDENAFNQAAAAAARANKDSFEFNGKTYKTKMDKSTAHKLDDDVDMLRKLAGLA